MKTGIWKSNGLAAEFVLVRAALNSPGFYWVRTVAGIAVAHESELTFA